MLNTLTGYRSLYLDNTISYQQYYTSIAKAFGLEKLLKHLRKYEVVVSKNRKLVEKKLDAETAYTFFSDLPAMKKAFEAHGAIPSRHEVLQLFQVVYGSLI